MSLLIKIVDSERFKVSEVSYASIFTFDDKLICKPLKIQQKKNTPVEIFLK